MRWSGSCCQQASLRLCADGAACCSRRDGKQQQQQQQQQQQREQGRVAPGNSPSMGTTTAGVPRSHSRLQTACTSDDLPLPGTPATPTSQGEGLHQGAGAGWLRVCSVRRLAAVQESEARCMRCSLCCLNAKPKADGCTACQTSTAPSTATSTAPCLVLTCRRAAPALPALGQPAHHTLPPWCTPR